MHSARKSGKSSPTQNARRGLLRLDASGAEPQPRESNLRTSPPYKAVTMLPMHPT
jgi:hypothetical protein